MVAIPTHLLYGIDPEATTCGLGVVSDPDHLEVCLTCAGALRRAERQAWVARLAAWVKQHEPPAWATGRP